MSGEQWKDYKRLVADGIDPSEAYGRIMPDRSLGINDRRWLRWLDHCREKADVEGDGCIMAVRNAPFEYVAAEEEPNPDPFEWGLEGKPERATSEYRTAPNPSLTRDPRRIESSCVVSGFAPAWVYVRDAEDAYRRVEDWE